MPNYDFECECGHTETELRMISKRNDVKQCSKCSKTMTRQIGAGSGVIFKGTGFFATDYRKDN